MYAFSTGDVAAFKKFAADHERPLVGVLDANSNNKAYKSVKVSQCLALGKKGKVKERNYPKP